MSRLVQAQLKDVLDAYGSRDVKAAQDVWERDGEIDRDTMKAAGESGLIGLSVPEEFGGAGSTVSDLAAMVDEAAAALVPGPLATTALATLVLPALVLKKKATS